MKPTRPWVMWFGLVAAAGSGCESSCETLDRVVCQATACDWVAGVIYCDALADGFGVQAQEACAAALDGASEGALDIDGSDHAEVCAEHIRAELGEEP